MDHGNKFIYTPLSEPKCITEQYWPDDILPIVCTRTYAYMHENYLNDCIEGILMQKTTFPVWVTIHDDASTDGTVEIIKKYQRKYPKLIKTYFQEINTYSLINKYEKFELRKPFRNYQIGKYIALCEGDDYWTDPLKLQKQVEFMESNDGYSLCYHSFKTKIGDRISKKTYPSIGRDYTADELIATPSGIMTASKLFINYYEGKIIKRSPKSGGDYMLNAFLGIYGKCKFLNSISPCVRRQHSGGVWTSKDDNSKIYGIINTKIKVYNFFKSQKDYHRMNLSLAALKYAIEKYLPSSSHMKYLYNIRLTYRGVGFIFHYQPLLDFIKKTIKRITRK